MKFKVTRLLKKKKSAVITAGFVLSDITQIEDMRLT